MILPGILRALRARNAFIYRVSVGERCELFATREAATRFASQLDHLAPVEVPVAIITAIAASSLAEPDQAPHKRDPAFDNPHHGHPWEGEP